MSLNPNAVLPHGTDARRRTHWAYGELCLRCEPDEEWTARCPVCLSGVTARGGVVLRHEVDSLWPHGAKAVECPGVGEKADLPVPRGRPIRRPRTRSMA
jgi:hypothetical protein